MQLLILGKGKTGSLVAECARARRHHVKVCGRAENVNCAALQAEELADTRVVIDFTNPAAVVENIRAAAAQQRPIVVGTTGWMDRLPEITELVNQHGGALLHGANFSIGVNLFYELARTAAQALKHHYSGQIFERHHEQKKDAPSGTAKVLQSVIEENSGKKLEITSFREGDVVGMHELVFSSHVDTLYLCHDAKTRMGFAEGAVRAAEWIVGRRGVFDFRDIWQEV